MAPARMRRAAVHTRGSERGAATDANAADAQQKQAGSRESTAHGDPTHAASLRSSASLRCLCSVVPSQLRAALSVSPMHAAFVRSSRRAASAAAAAGPSALLRAPCAAATSVAAPAAAAAASAGLHTSSLSLSRSDYVPEVPRRVPRPNHFAPLPPPALKEVPELPLKKVKGLHKLVEPRMTPQEGTHTLNIQPTTYRMQFQLEPATRTKVKKEGVNAKILDYTRAEAFTRAPWPSFREIVINRPRHLHALNPALILQIQNLIMALEFNKDITAGTLSPTHGGPTLKIHGLAGQAIKALMLNDPTVNPSTYEKSFSVGMCLDTILKAVRENLEGKARHKERLEQYGENWLPSDLELTRDAHPGVPNAAKYFRSLYAFAFKMSNVRVPLVTILDGLTLGAGAGVFLQGRYRVATENTRIAYPQAAQGWFPDAGGSYTLSHLDGNMGMFLALTGYPVRGYDAIRLGLATHYCESDETHRFGKRMGDSSLHYQFAEDTIEQAFGMFSPGPTHFPLPLHEMHRVVDDIFGERSIERVFTKIGKYLEENAEDEAAAGGSGSEKTKADDASALLKPSKSSKRPKRHSPAVVGFVNDILNRLLAASPTSLKIIFKQIRLAQFLPLERCIQLEYRIANRLLLSKENPLEQSDLFRTAPNWTRTNFKQIPDSEVDAICEEHWDKTEELVLEYPQKKKPVWYI